MKDLSIVIPFRDNIAELKSCLLALKKQETGYDFQVIVIDDGSRQNNKKELEKIGLDLRNFYQE